MATMDGSTSPPSSPVSSDSSLDGPGQPQPHPEAFPPSAHRNSPEPKPRPESASVVACEWNECGQRFTNMQSLVDHLHNDHIGVHKSSYTCEWATCPRRGLVQTSRFALVSHCRSHTGEKPFICTLPECDKSFTRSDTLAKHMRQQHNIEPAASTRGGYRKRKRSMTPPHPPVQQQPVHQPAPPPPAARTSPSPPPHPDAPSHYNFANRTYAHFQDPRDSGFNTFRVNPAIHDRPAASASSTLKFHHPDPVPPHEARREESPSSSEGDEEGKAHNPEAVGGRSKAMVKYLIMKAKYRYVMAEKSLLNDELEALKRQEKEEWREKEAGVDRVLRVFGPQSEALIHEPEGPPPTNGKRPSISPRDELPSPHLPRHDPHRMEVDAR